MTGPLMQCPETGRDLTGLDLRKHAAALWPNLDATDTRYEEARRRKKLLLDEAARRDLVAERERGAAADQK